MSLLVVGSVAFDSVETPHGNVQDVLGGSATYFSTAASFFSPVRLVAVVGDDFPQIHMDFLKERGVDMEGLQRIDGKTFRWAGRYHPNMNDRDTLFTELNVFSLFSPDIPACYRDSKMIFLGNIDPVLQLTVLDQISNPMLIACDTMDFWISGALEALKKVIGRVQILIINDEEARLLSGDHNLVRAAKAVQAMGPRHVVVKRGENGALLFSGDSVFAAPAMPLERVIDPTGAGDTFAGGFMGCLACKDVCGPGDIRKAMVTGTVMASFCVEDFSVNRMSTLTKAEIDQRMNQFETMVTI